MRRAVWSGIPWVLAMNWVATNLVLASSPADGDLRVERSLARREVSEELEVAADPRSHLPPPLQVLLKSFKVVDLNGDQDGYPDTNETVDLFASIRNPTRFQNLTNVGGANCRGHGTFDSGSPRQVGARDAEIEASTRSCP